MIRPLSIVGMILLGMRAAAASPAETVRVYAFEPASFDYVFTAIVSSCATNPILSLNHRAGRTYFVHPGDRVGEYLVRDFHPEIKRVFNPTIKMYQDHKGGCLTLQAAPQPPLVLELGKRLPQPGWMAYLVDLADGNWWSVKEDDRVITGKGTLVVGPISTNSVTLYATGQTNQAVRITPGEAEQLSALWATRMRRQTGPSAEELAEAEERDSWIEEAKNPAPQPAARPKSETVEMRYPSRTYFGTIVPCPVEYMVLPGIWSTSGRMIRPTMVVPRRFQPRATGISLEYRESPPAALGSSRIALPPSGK